MEELVSLGVKLWASGTLVVEEKYFVPNGKRDQFLTRLGMRHAAMVEDRFGKDVPFMVEIEFLDEPDVNERFLRFGTDPKGMMDPIAINLDEN